MNDRAVIFDLGGVVLGWEPHRATLTGAVPGTGAVIAELARAGVGLFALTNWSAETFQYAQQRFGLLRRFTDILVSGAEQLAKPDPAIFRRALDRFGLDPAATVFVDDMPVNVEAARTVGLTGLAFHDATRLRSDLADLGLLGDPEPVTEPIFHLTEGASWAQALDTGRYPWSTRGLTVDAEGFVHCSYPHQWPEIRTRYFGDRPAEDLVLLTLDPARLSVPIVVEDLGAGVYPHLYGELPVGDVVSATSPTE